MRILVTGASGQLGGYLLRRLRGGADVAAWSGTRRGDLFGVRLRPVDLGDAGAVADAFRRDRPAVVVHAGALARVADCHRDPDRAARVNTAGTAALAELAAGARARLVYVSTDLVFDGERGGYREDDPPAPLSVYGRSKADAEAAVLAVPGGVVARVSLLFGPSLTGRPTFFDEQVAALRAGRPVTLFPDEWRTPLGLAAAAESLLGVAFSDLTGMLHLGGPERLSRLEMGQRLAAFLDADPSAIVAVKREQAPAAEPRPRDVSLDCSRWRGLFPGQPWPTWEEALREMPPADPAG
jgi:dTDP-4-dehydrorhamnose reductase